MDSVPKSGNSCSVLCPSLCCWKFNSPMKTVFRFQCNARSIQCLSVRFACSSCVIVCDCTSNIYKQLYCYCTNSIKSVHTSFLRACSFSFSLNLSEFSKQLSGAVFVLLALLLFFLFRSSSDLNFAWVFLCLQIHWLVK